MMFLMKSNHTFYEVREEVRKWAAKNAFTLIFMSMLFILTWALMVILHFMGKGAM